MLYFSISALFWLVIFSAGALNIVGFSPRHFSYSFMACLKRVSFIDSLNSRYQ